MKPHWTALRWPKLHDSPLNIQRERRRSSIILPLPNPVLTSNPVFYFFWKGYNLHPCLITHSELKIPTILCHDTHVTKFPVLSNRDDTETVMVGFRSGERQRRFSGRLRHLKTPVWLEKLFRKSRYMWLLCTGACVYGKSKKARKNSKLPWRGGNGEDKTSMMRLRVRWEVCKILRSVWVRVCVYNLGT